MPVPKDVNCIASGGMEETTWSSSDYVDEDSPRRRQVPQSEAVDVVQNWPV